MKKKFIKRAIPAEISDKGGAYVQFVEKDTVPLDGVIIDAIDGSYCQGRPTLILAAIQGLLKSMARGVATDGHPRQIADYITVYLVVDGEIDLDRGFNPEVNSLKIRARLLNEMEIDITGWALEDVTPGRRFFTLASAYTGNVKGAWEIGESGEINGDNVPSTRTGEAIRVDWAVEGTDKCGTIPADKVTSNISRIDIAADALAEIASEEYDGKTIVFTVRGNFSSAKIAATLRYVAPVERLTVAYTDDNGERTDGIVYAAEDFQFDGENLDFGEDDEVVLKVDGTDNVLRLGKTELDEGSATHLKFIYTRKDFDPEPADGAALTITYKGSTVHATYRLSRG